MIEKEYEYIRGNTAVQPKRREFEKQKSYKDLHKEKIQKLAKLKEARGKTNRAFAQVVAVMFVLGCGTLIRDAKIYKLQSQLEQIKTDTKVVTDNNEALRVDLLKFTSIDTIRAKAVELGMVAPDNKKVVNVDMSTDYFPGVTKDSNKDS